MLDFESLCELQEKIHVAAESEEYAKYLENQMIDEVKDGVKTVFRLLKEYYFSIFRCRYELETNKIDKTSRLEKKPDFSESHLSRNDTVNNLQDWIRCHFHRAHGPVKDWVTFSYVPGIFGFFLTEESVQCYLDFLLSIDYDYRWYFVRPLFYTPEFIQFVISCFRPKCSSRVTLEEVRKRWCKKYTKKCPRSARTLLKDRQDLLTTFFTEELSKFPQLFDLAPEIWQSWPSKWYNEGFIIDSSSETTQDLSVTYMNYSPFHMIMDSWDFAFARDKSPPRFVFNSPQCGSEYFIFTSDLQPLEEPVVSETYPVLAFRRLLTLAPPLRNFKKPSTLTHGFVKGWLASLLSSEEVWKSFDADDLEEKWNARPGLILCDLKSNCEVEFKRAVERTRRVISCVSRVTRDIQRMGASWKRVEMCRPAYPRSGCTYLTFLLRRAELATYDKVMSLILRKLDRPRVDLKLCKSLVRVLGEDVDSARKFHDLMEWIEAAEGCDIEAVLTTTCKLFPRKFTIVSNLVFCYQHIRREDPGAEQLQAFESLFQVVAKLLGRVNGFNIGSLIPRECKCVLIGERSQIESVMKGLSENGDYSPSGELRISVPEGFQVWNLTVYSQMRSGVRFDFGVSLSKSCKNPKELKCYDGSHHPMPGRNVVIETFGRWKNSLGICT